MTIKTIIIESLADITGLDIDELKENCDMDLFSTGILDSMSVVNLISQIESKTNKVVDFTKHQPEEFLTINSISNVYEEESNK